MKIGGTDALIDEVKMQGGEAGPETIWLTPGAERWGMGYLDNFFKRCRNESRTPLVFAWLWGDAISPNAIRNGVADKYQKTTDGKPIWITVDKCLAWLKMMAQMAQIQGVSPIVVVEHEFSKGGTEKDPAPFAAYFDKAAATVKAACPSARVVFCPGVWSDMTLIAKNFTAQIGKTDIIGLQTLLFRPRHGENEFTQAGPILTAKFKTLRGTSNKPIAVIDLGFSSYGGNYSATHPFAGGNGVAGQWLQAKAMESVRDALTATGDVAFVCYRALDDDATFNVANYGGYAERHLGIRGKPAYAILMSMAKPPEPKLYTESQMNVVAQARDLAIEDKQAAEIARDAARTRAVVLLQRIEAAGAILGGAQ